MEIAKAVRELVIDEGIKQAFEYLAERAAWVNWPIINPVLQYIIRKIIALSFDATILGVNIIWIELESRKELNDVRQATQKIKELEANENATEQDIENAKENFRNAARNLIRIRDKRL